MNERNQIDWPQLKTLWRLHLTLILRQFGREKGLILNIIFALLIFGPVVGVITVVTANAYRTYDRPFAVLAALLIGLWTFWMLSPIIFSALNEQTDVTRLLTYPINQRTLVASVLLGTLADYSTYFLVPLFLAVIYGFAWVWHPAALVVLLVLVLAFLHLIIAHQLVVTAVGGLLQSRRLRDVIIVLMSTLGMLCYFIQVGVARLGEMLVNFSQQESGTFLNMDPMQWLQWLPTGALARVVEYSLADAWTSSFFWLIYSVGWLLVLGWIWHSLLIRLATGHGYSLQLSNQAKQPTAVATPKNNDGPRWIPSDIYLLFKNEMRLLWRIPQRRIGIIQGNLMPLFFLVPLFFSNDTPDFDISSLIPIWVGLALPLYSMFLYWANGQNMLAWEGPGLPTLLLSPVKRVHIFWAKSAALYLVTLLPVLVMVLLLSRLRWDWSVQAAAAISLLIGWTSLAVTAVASVLLPVPIRADAKQARSIFSTGGNAKTGCLSVLIVPPAIFVMGLPACLPLALAYALKLPWVAFVGVLLSAGYTAVLFYSGTQLASRLLQEREPEFLASLKLADE